MLRSPMSANTNSRPFGPPRAPEDSRPPALATASLRWITAAGEQRRIDGEVGDFTSGGAVFYVPESFDVGQTVWLSCEGQDRRTRVEHCEKRRNKHLVVLRFVEHERRRGDRWATAGAGTLLFSDSARGRFASVQVVDFHTAGAQVEIGEYLRPGQAVCLIGGMWECLGLVRYCRKEGEKFRAGVQFTQPPYPKRRSVPCR